MSFKPKDTPNNKVRVIKKCYLRFAKGKRDPLMERFIMMKDIYYERVIKGEKAMIKLYTHYAREGSGEKSKFLYVETDKFARLFVDSVEYNDAVRRGVTLPVIKEERKK